MPTGTDKIQQLAKESQARSDAYNSGEGFQRGLYLKDGQTAKGRFLEEGTGVWYLYTHPLPLKQGQKYADKVLCLDQPFSEAEEANYVEGSKPCRGCEIEGISRSTRVVINFIRYDEPKLVRGADGKPLKDAAGNYMTDGVEPALVVCNFSTKTGSMIPFLETQYGPLSNQICVIQKTSDNQNPFMIAVVGPNVPPDHPDAIAASGASGPFERALNDKKVPPPKAITALSPRFMSLPLLSYGDMVRAYSGASVPSGFQPQAGPATQQLAEQGNYYAKAAQDHANRLNLDQLRS